MRKLYFKSLLLIFMAFQAASVSMAQVQVTPAPGLYDICAFGQFYTLGEIKIEETVPDGFYQGFSQTYEILLPAELEFNTAATPNIILSGQEVANVSSNLTANSFTITYDVGGFYNLDAISVNGLQIRAVGLFAGNVYRTGGTAIQTGNEPGIQPHFYVSSIMPPEITQHPVDLTVCDGSQAIFSVSAVGNNLYYQWQADNGTGFSNLQESTQFIGVNSPNLQVLADPNTNNVRYRCEIFSPCGNALSTEAILSVQPRPLVNAGSDATICSNSSLFLYPEVLNAPIVLWTTTGNGAFSPNPNTLNAQYFPAQGESGNIILTLTADGGACPDVSDELILTIEPQPFADTGPDQVHCEDIISIGVKAVVTNAAGGTWSTNGSGYFLDPYSLNTSYEPSPADKTTGMVELTFTTSYNATCAPATDNMIITFSPMPVVNAGNDDTICSNSTLFLNPTIANTQSVNWTTTGAGYFSPDPSTLNATYHPSQTDAGTSIRVKITATGQVCPPVSDELILTVNQGPVVTAGPDQTICQSTAPVSLSGTVSETIPVTWSSSGNGTFSDPNILTTSYQPSATDLSSGSVIITLTTTSTATCPPASDTLTITFSPAPTAHAGADQTTCGSSPASLTGTVTGATGGMWSTTGSGIFADPYALNTTYQPSANDVSAGSVTIRLSTTGNGSCQAATDDMIIQISPSPIANAGVDYWICDTSPVTITGNVSGASGGTWTSSGTGTLSDPNALTTTYQPSANDMNAGSVTITLTTTGNGSCAPSSDDMVIQLTPSPTANAGPDQTVCQSVPEVYLSGSVSGATGATWTSTGSGTFTTGSNSLNATYQPSAADVSAGSVTITLTTTGTGSCNVVSDQMIITFISSPIADAGPDQSVCMNSNIVLSGTVVGATGGHWSGGQGIFSPNSTTLNATYFPTSTEKMSGSITLFLTSTGNGGCEAVTDFFTVTFSPAPLVDAGVNQAMSASSGNQLEGVIRNASGGVWSTDGTGTFSSATDLAAVYTPSTDDKNKKKVTLTLTSTGNGTCNAVSDQMVLTNNAVVCNVDMNLYYNNNNVTFEAFNTDGQSVGSYHWDFGDGHNGSGKIQSNVYSQAGTYFVSVSYSTPDSACMSVGYDTVYISNASIPTYFISGTVNAGGSSLDNCILTLFKFDGYNYDYLRAKQLTAADGGAFIFNNLENGYYLVHALPAPNSSFFDGFLPTYYGNDTIWEDAAFIQLNNGNFTAANISLMAFTPTNATWNTGHAGIFGTITFDQGVLLKTTNSENPVENAVVTLYNSSGDRLTSTYTDPYGNYSFENMEAGDYFMDVEYAGTNMSGSTSISTDGTSGSQVESNSSLQKEEITLGLTQNFKASSINIFPNPATEHISMEVPELKGQACTIRVLSSNGVLLMEETNKSGSGVINLQIESLNQGIYMIEIRSGEKLFINRFVKN